MISIAVPQPTPLPYQACDCHMHVFDDTYPTAANATLPPTSAGLEQYAEVQRALGFSRHVLVQPSAYGTDNSLFLDTLRLQPSTTRGIAVVDASISDSSLSSLEYSGVVGIRFNQVQAGATSMDMFDSLAFRAKELGWHIQLYLTPAQLLAQEHRLAKSPVPIVLDHFASIFSQPDLSDLCIQSLKRLLSSGNTWLKLSAPYLASAPQDGGLEALRELTRSLIVHHSERLVWGTNWPHATETFKPNDVQLLQWFRDIFDCSTAERNIFVRSPAALYHFDE
ncbi:hypothetical protein B1219_18470 [Pseudomonas ogarae]|uniref:amidohydrolase family protein n=1 Tax=Pseudomonas ogarae (strain DSM 112162 / CECT 30235 / F113) TaxID=1114970 RepID=UPI0009A46C28|nr:amidohydrolase family protein [Pseudomonas ogarae]OPG72139.1 hypothetical protein B1219_18470 [Pseudomonas ogarae]